MRTPQEENTTSTAVVEQTSDNTVAEHEVPDNNSPATETTSTSTAQTNGNHHHHHHHKGRGGNNNRGRGRVNRGGRGGRVGNHQAINNNNTRGGNQYVTNNNTRGQHSNYNNRGGSGYHRGGHHHQQHRKVNHQPNIVTIPANTNPQQELLPPQQVVSQPTYAQQTMQTVQQPVTAVPTESTTPQERPIVCFGRYTIPKTIVWNDMLKYLQTQVPSFSGNVLNEEKIQPLFNDKYPTTYVVYINFLLPGLFESVLAYIKYNAAYFAGLQIQGPHPPKPIPTTATTTIKQQQEQ